MNKEKKVKKIGFLWCWGKVKLDENKINRDLGKLVKDYQHLTLKDGRIIKGKPKKRKYKRTNL